MSSPELTPETLRARQRQDDRCEGGTHYGCSCITASQRWIDLHADAWAADRARLEAAERAKAEFLWPSEDDSVEALGYEFVNAKTEVYREEVWKALLAALAREEKP